MSLLEAVPSGGSEAVATELSSARLRIAVARMARWLRPTAAAGALTATAVDLRGVAQRGCPISPPFAG